MDISTFASGSTGNCALICADSAHILVDAGISMKRIALNLGCAGLCLSDIDCILITHEHTDHISGLATMIKNGCPPIYAPRAVARRLFCKLPGIERVLHEFEAGDGFCIGGAEITSFCTPHDSAGSVGYRVSDSFSSLGYCTDLGYVPENVLSALSGCDIALIESNHDIDMLKNGSYPLHLKGRVLGSEGHLSNEDCATLACALARSGTGRLILAHLSRENNTPAKAYNAVSECLARESLEAEVCVAPMASLCRVESAACRR